MTIKTVAGGLLGAALILSAGAAQAAVAGDLIINGSFEQTSAAQSAQITAATYDSNKNITTQGNVTGWSNTGYNFIFKSQAGTTSGSEADNIGTTNGVKLYGPGTGNANATGNAANAYKVALTKGLTVSGDGGNFIGADDNYQTGPVSQVVNGLKAGAGYYLTFLWAGAQQAGYAGDTQDQWTVTFGNAVQKTANITVKEGGFSGWMTQTFYFTASAAQQTLSFLATGTPGGQPPFALLDGVSLVAAPEPATLTLVAAGLAGLGIMSRKRRRKSGAAAQA